MAQAGSTRSSGRSPEVQSPASARHSPQTVISIQALVLLTGILLFAAAQSWYSAGAGWLHSVPALLAGVLLGIIASNLVHEWSHFGAALLVGARIDPVSRLRLFVFNWNFQHNSARQFLVMSYAGTFGSLLVLVLLALLLSPGEPGGIAALAGATGSLVFAAIIEWPVLYRVHGGKAPLDALLKIGRRTVYAGAGSGTLAGLVTASWLLAT